MSDLRTQLVMTVYNDAVKLETEEYGKRRMIGWFRDEVSAISAAVEHVLMSSAILSSLRRLPELVILSEYRAEWIKRPVVIFKRATRIKCDGNGRRVVRKPGTFGKPWIPA